MGSTIPTATYEEVKDLPNHPEKLLIDVREPQEIIDTGIIPTSVNIPCKFNFKLQSFGFCYCEWPCYSWTVGYVRRSFSDETSDREFELLYKIKKPKLDDYLIFSCRTGNRSGKAIDEIVPLGYTK